MIKINLTMYHSQKAKEDSNAPKSIANHAGKAGKSMPAVSVLQQKSHDKGCSCNGCRVTASNNTNSTVQFVLSASQSIAPVIQAKWKCSNCGLEGEGKPKKKCPDCRENTLEEVQDGPLSFGDWWESLDNETRMELLRAHGSHEDTGGGTRKNQGGGGKGNQHSDGVARAKKQIKKKYDKGDYE